MLDLPHRVLRSHRNYVVHYGLEAANQEGLGVKHKFTLTCPCFFYPCHRLAVGNFSSFAVLCHSFVRIGSHTNTTAAHISYSEPALVTAFGVSTWLAAVKDYLAIVNTNKNG